MTPALILFALGLADWLTTRSIIAHGGSEGNPVARKAIARFGFTQFFVGKAMVMGVFGAATSLLPGGVWIAGIVAVIVGAVVVHNVIVLGRL